MNRFQHAFASAERPLVFPYLTAGFPTPAETNELTLAAIRGGAAGLEIGVVFSDPLADGPTIQRANTAALAAGATVETALDATRAVRASGSDAPITLMGYLNPFLAYRAEAPTWDNQATPADEVGRPLEPIAAAAAAAGVDGIILVDLPVEESDPARDVLATHGINLIYLLAPTSTPQRIAAVAERAAGFYLSGQRDRCGLARGMRWRTTCASSYSASASTPDLPLAVGFGIRNRAHVETVGQLCEAAVIGSALTTTIAESAAGRPRPRGRAIPRGGHRPPER